jgi:hypothetical protein
MSEHKKRHKEKPMIRTTSTCTLAVAVALAAFGSAGAARAQDTGIIPFRAKVGGFFAQGDAKDFAGSTTFIVEADAAIPNLGQGKYFVSAGYSQGSDAGRKLRFVPVTIGRYFSPPNPLKGVTGNVYGGVGLGQYFVRVANGVASESKTTIGGFGVNRLQLPSKVFIEAKYHVAGKVAGVRPKRACAHDRPQLSRVVLSRSAA